MLDLVIRGRKVVTPMGTGAFDVAIQGEQIVAVASAGTYDAGSTRRLIDAGERTPEAGQRRERQGAKDRRAQRAQDAGRALGQGEHREFGKGILDRGYRDPLARPADGGQKPHPAGKAGERAAPVEQPAEAFPGR